MVRGIWWREGQAGPRERQTSLYYKKMMVGPREGQRMSRERTIRGCGMFGGLPGADWTCICELRQERINAVLV